MLIPTSDTATVVMLLALLGVVVVLLGRGRR
jgi:cbb3-type cytochrome oxidase subunit 3